MSPHRLDESGRFTRATPCRPALNDESTWRCSGSALSAAAPAFPARTPLFQRRHHAPRAPAPPQLGPQASRRGVPAPAPPPSRHAGAPECGSSTGEREPPAPRGPAPPAHLLRAKPQPRPRRPHPPALPLTPRRARAQRGGGRRGGGAGVQRLQPSDACEAATSPSRRRLGGEPAGPGRPPDPSADAAPLTSARVGAGPSLSLGHCRRNAAVVPPLPWPAEASPQRRPRRL